MRQHRDAKNAARRFVKDRAAAVSFDQWRESACPIGERKNGDRGEAEREVRAIDRSRASPATAPDRANTVARCPLKIGGAHGNSREKYECFRAVGQTEVTWS